jgi:hypothetical protein
VRRILKHILIKGARCKEKKVSWIHLAEDRNDWRELVNSVINFWGPVKLWQLLD